MGRKSKKHRRDEGAHECSECGKSFKTDRKLERHMLKAHGKKPLGPTVKWGAAILALIALVVVGLVLAGGGGPGDVADTRAENMERFDANDDPLMGNASAPVVLVEFGAPACPSCRFFHTDILPDLKRNYIDTGQVAYIFSQFQLYDFDEPGGIAQECVFRHAGDDAYWNFTDLLYRNQGDVNANNLDDVMRDFADRNGHDGEAFVDCYADRATEDAWNADILAGRRNDVSGTPTFFLFGETGEAVRVGAGDLDRTIRDMLADAEAGA